MNASTKKKKIDFNSIKAATMVYFMLFSVFLICIIWVLQDFFLNNYYELLRSQEASRTANTIELQYMERDKNFHTFALDTARSSSIYIRLDEGDISNIFDGTSNLKNSYALSDHLKNAKDKLDSSPLDSVTAKIVDKKNNIKYLVYVSNLGNPSGFATLYVVTPLIPDKSTVMIIRSMLLYISLIVLVLALFLSIFLSHKLAQPIENITESARKLSKGNYNVQFDGGNFTETNDLAKVLNTASYEMEKSDFYQREIIANVSHDLKTPLTMIKSYAEMINDISGDNPAKRKEHLGVIISETDRLNKLVTDMMSASKLQSNAITLDKQYFDIVELAKEAFESVAVLNDQEGYDINFDPCKTSMVYADPDKISQVMHNFISNAVKYCGEDKYINIELKRSSKKVSFHVIDHGDGIPAEEISHVWERYYRTSANHEREIDGSGIGLSIVKSILSLHNANYGVKSKEGSGSDFWFEMNIEKNVPGDKGRNRKKQSVTQKSEQEPKQDAAQSVETEPAQNSAQSTNIKSEE